MGKKPNARKIKSIKQLVEMKVIKVKERETSKACPKCKIKDLIEECLF